MLRLHGPCSQFSRYVGQLGSGQRGAYIAHLEIESTGVRFHLVAVTQCFHCAGEIRIAPSLTESDENGPKCCAPCDASMRNDPASSDQKKLYLDSRQSAYTQNSPAPPTKPLKNSKPLKRKVNTPKALPPNTQSSSSLNLTRKISQQKSIRKLPRTHFQQLLQFPALREQLASALSASGKSWTKL